MENFRQKLNQFLTSQQEVNEKEKRRTEAEKRSAELKTAAEIKEREKEISILSQNARVLLTPFLNDINAVAARNKGVINLETRPWNIETGGGFHKYSTVTLSLVWNYKRYISGRNWSAEWNGLSLSMGFDGEVRIYSEERNQEDNMNIKNDNWRELLGEHIIKEASKGFLRHADNYPPDNSRYDTPGGWS